jgi:uncharacterized protein YegP (UPF0339 family)
MAHFETFKDKAGKHRFRLKADNGEIVCSSEPYDSKENARRGCTDLAGIALAAIQGQATIKDA